jgi:hypothetical protein
VHVGGSCWLAEDISGNYRCRHGSRLNQNHVQLTMDGFVVSACTQLALTAGRQFDAEIKLLHHIIIVVPE